jgi:MinD-like ATPase involved in chromosome partitioning or flagellar assembly
MLHSFTDKYYAIFINKSKNLENLELTSTFILHIIVITTIILHVITGIELKTGSLTGGNVLGRLKLVILDGDREYLANFEKFLAANYPQRFDIFTFSSPEKLLEFLSGTVQADILAINSRIYEKGCCFNHPGIVLLSGDEDGSPPEGMACVKKYQHMDRLVAEMTRLYTARSLKECTITGPGNTRIISVHSPSGGTGKSFVAAGCSILCAGRGIKTFYLNLESIPSTDLFFQGNPRQSFSNVIFYLKGKSGNLALKLESAKCIDAVTGVHFFKPPENACEMSELSVQETDWLLAEFRRSGVYDIVFVDMPSGLCPANIEVLRHSDVILSVLSPDWRSVFKLKNLKTSLEFIEHRLGIELASRIVPVLNKAADLEGYDRYNAVTDELGLLSGIRVRRYAELDNSHVNISGNVNFLTDLNNVLERILQYPTAGMPKSGEGGGSVA